MDEHDMTAVKSAADAKPAAARKSPARTRKPAASKPKAPEGTVPPADPALVDLQADVAQLAASVAEDGAALATRWDGWVETPEFAPSAANLSHYLALRHRDLRPLQRRLMAAGLSSLGRAESRVMPTLHAVERLLGAATGQGLAASASSAAQVEHFFAGEERIRERADALLGALQETRPTRLLVTVPGEAAGDPSFFIKLANLGVEAVRINCAHDGESAWASMIAHVEAAAHATGRRMKVMMDLPGPKIRTGALKKGKNGSRVFPESELAVVRPGHLDAAPRKLPAIECELGQALEAAEPGHRVFIDDGKLAATVLSAQDWGLVLGIDTGPEIEGYKLKPEKGINFPDSDVLVPALTADDRELLPFVARHADGVEFSFVQAPEDVEELQAALARERPEDWRSIGLVLKVETRRAVRNLPDMLVRAAGRQPTAVMIARGDLAVEIGFARLAEMQEEILWLCEAAHVPVIWATQVMESLMKTGIASRGEMTDAAMAARAECVMLNKGPHLFRSIAVLEGLLTRMGGHMHKKAHLLRSLQSW